MRVSQGGASHCFTLKYRTFHRSIWDTRKQSYWLTRQLPSVRVENKLGRMAGPKVSYLNRGQDSWLARKREAYLPTEGSCCHFLCPRAVQVTPETTVKVTSVGAMESGKLDLPGSTTSRGVGLVKRKKKKNQEKCFPRGWQFQEPAGADMQ